MLTSMLAEISIDQRNASESKVLARDCDLMVQLPRSLMCVRQSASDIVGVACARRSNGGSSMTVNTKVYGEVCLLILLKNS